MQPFVQNLKETWFFWIFFLVVGFMNGRAEETGQISKSADLVATFTFPFIVALWVGHDARRHQRPLGYGYTALVFFLWPILAPIYLFQTRGIKAILTLIAFAVLSLITLSLGILNAVMTQS